MTAMKALGFSLLIVLIALSGCASRGPTTMVDPVTGKWEGKWGPSPDRQTEVVLELKWDGSHLTGTINPGSRAIEISKGTFDPGTNAISMELDSTNNRGETDHYAIQGKVDGNKMSGTWTRNNGSGDFHITKD
jgi:hypothetical protein